MNSVNDFYNKYNYPKVNLYTHRQERNHKNLINEILSYANINLSDLKGKRVLDAGCGTGDKSIFFARHGIDVVALDFSEGQLNEARFRAEKENVNVKFIKKDLIIDNLNELGKFDLIICLGVLHHTENPKKGFENLVKLLNPGGKVIIGLYHKYARLRYRILRFLIRLFISKDPDKIMYWLKKSRIAKSLIRASDPTLYDRYCVPYESYHLLSEIKAWFKENNIEFIGNSKNVNGIELFKVFEGKSIFFVAGNKLK